MSSRIAFLFILFVGLLTVIESFKVTMKAQHEPWVTSLSNATIYDHPMKHYVNRPALESKILGAYKEKLDDTWSRYEGYTILVGPLGSGKTSVLTHTLGNLPGVLQVTANPEETYRSLFNQIKSFFGANPENFGNVVSFSDLLPMFMKITEYRDGLPITIIIKVELAGCPMNKTALNAVFSAAVNLAKAVNVIVLLSDVSTLEPFDHDYGEEFIWVDGMENEEAVAYAKKLYPAVDENDLQLLFEKLGTLPLDITYFVEDLKKGVTAADIIHQKLAVSRRKLAAFPFKPILDALRESPDGVRISKLAGVECKGVRLILPMEVVACSDSPVVYYPRPPFEYRFGTKADRTAFLEQK